MLLCGCAGGTAGLVCPHTANTRMAACSIIAGGGQLQANGAPSGEECCWESRAHRENLAQAACTAQVWGRMLPTPLQTAQIACSRIQVQQVLQIQGCRHNSKFQRGLCDHRHAPGHTPPEPEGLPTQLVDARNTAPHQSGTALRRGCQPAAQRRAAPCQQRWLPAQKWDASNQTREPPCRQVHEGR